jgi:hypothetical protein
MLPLAQLGPTTVLFMFGLIMTAGALLWRAQRQAQKANRAKLLVAEKAQPDPQTTKNHLQAPREFQRWQVEMHDLARELSGQLDSKLGLLQHLVREADQQAARLEAAIERAASLGITPTSVMSTDEPPWPTANQASRLSSAAASRFDPPTERPTVSRRHAEIYSLADAGHPSAIIASRVGSPIGEVELILSLRDRA